MDFPKLKTVNNNTILARLTPNVSLLASLNCSQNIKANGHKVSP